MKYGQASGGGLPDLVCGRWGQLALFWARWPQFRGLLAPKRVTAYAAGAKLALFGAAGTTFAGFWPQSELQLTPVGPTCLNFGACGPLSRAVGPRASCSLRRWGLTCFIMGPAVHYRGPSAPERVAAYSAGARLALCWGRGPAFAGLQPQSELRLSPLGAGLLYNGARGPLSRIFSPKASCC